MLRTEVHIPKVSNGGTPFRQDLFDTTESELLDIAGGFTVHEAEGGWKASDGTIYVDPQKVYTIDSDIRLADEALEVIRRRFEQLELYVVTFTIG